MWKLPFSTSLVGLVACVAAGTALARTPVGVSPEGATREVCPTFSWSLVEGASGYELVVYELTESGEVGTDPLIATALPEGVQSWTPPAGRCLAPGGQYAWLLRSLGHDDASWSEPTVFEIVGRPSPDEVEAAMRTLRRYLADRADGGEAREDGVSKEAGRESERMSPRSRPETSGSSVRGPGRVLQALTSDTEGLTAIHAASAPSLGSPSLTVDSGIALGASSNLFKDGDVFLWDDASGNLALGDDALASAAGEATRNTAVGAMALYDTTQGTVATDSSYNTGVGFHALYANSTGSINTAVGDSALSTNNEGDLNTAVGSLALGENTTGSRNVAIGVSALFNTAAGTDNIAIGYQAGYKLGSSTFAPVSDLSNNIFIGHEGVFDQADAIRIGNSTHVYTYVAGIHGASVDGSSDLTVLVDSDGKLGTHTSSRRYKEGIADMAAASERLLDLRPVTFRFVEQGGPGPLRYGLIAEEVAEVFPELVVFDEAGRPFSVKYRLLSTLLLNELQEQDGQIRRQREEMVALRERVTALEEGRARSENGKPWWRRLFTRDRGSH